METRSAILGTRENPKELGAYYTDPLVADFLVKWALRSPRESIMDPGFGDGVFLKAACKRLAELGGNPRAQVLGVEISGRTFSRTSRQLHEEFGLPEQALLCKDFFALYPGSRRVDVVVGNPPFIRYQRFRGDDRERARKRVLSQRVGLSQLASSWAPFLVHAVSMVKTGGRLAMVVPFEITQAGYALSVFQHLSKTFERIIFLTFQKKIFSQLNQDALLLLAEGKGKKVSEILWHDLADSEELRNFSQQEVSNMGNRASASDREALCSGKKRLISYLIPARARMLYDELRVSPEFTRLGDLASVGIGYVTGANDYFHLSPQDLSFWEIPPEFVKRAVRRGASLVGLHYTSDDWEAGLESRNSGFLLHIEQDSPLTEGLERYLEVGEQSGVSATFKCRTRKPWYRVPHVVLPDAFLTYMSGVSPKLVANLADAVAPNSLHVVRIRPSAKLTAGGLATLWNNSLTALSAEIEGHALGGGMLKMEPREAREVLVPVAGNARLADLEHELDEICRTQGIRAARKQGDHAILRGMLGLSKRECSILEEGVDTLRCRRTTRAKRSTNAG